MKTQIAAVLLAGMLPIADGAAQEPFTFLGDAFVASYNNPEDFDEFILANLDRFDETFWSCHEAALDEYGPSGQADMQSCSQYTGEAEMRCINRNQAGQLTFWLLSIEEVLSSDTAWSETRLESTLISWRQFIRLLGDLAGAPGEIEAAFQIAADQIEGRRDLLHCY